MRAIGKRGLAQRRIALAWRRAEYMAWLHGWVLGVAVGLAASVWGWWYAQ